DSIGELASRPAGDLSMPDFLLSAYPFLAVLHHATHRPSLPECDSAIYNPAHLAALDLLRRILRGGMHLRPRRKVGQLRLVKRTAQISDPKHRWPAQGRSRRADARDEVRQGRADGPVCLLAATAS